MSTLPISAPENEPTLAELLGMSSMDEFVAEKMGDVINMLQGAYSEERRFRNLKRSHIAEHMGVDRAAITHILQGRRNITLRTLFQLLYCLDRDFEAVAPSLLRQPGRNEPAPASTMTINAQVHGAVKRGVGTGEMRQAGASGGTAYGPLSPLHAPQGSMRLPINPLMATANAG
jgi:predicted XRE-type DNA-binding protein